MSGETGHSSQVFGIELGSGIAPVSALLARGEVPVQPLRGPAVIQEFDATILVPHDYSVSRDAAALQATFATRAHEARAAALQAFDNGRWCGRAASEWPEFAPELPVPLEVPAGSLRLRAWGTLQVGPDGVCTACVPDEALADARLRRACVHLAHASLRSEVRHHLDFDPGYQPLVWSARGFGTPASLVQLAALRSVAQSCLVDSPTPRTAVELCGLVDAARARLLECARDTLRWMDSCSMACEVVQRELERPAPDRRCPRNTSLCRWSLGKWKLFFWIIPSGPPASISHSAGRWYSRWPRQIAWRG